MLRRVPNGSLEKVEPAPVAGAACTGYIVTVSVSAKRTVPLPGVSVDDGAPMEAWPSGAEALDGRSWRVVAADRACAIERRTTGGSRAREITGHGLGSYYP